MGASQQKSALAQGLGAFSLVLGAPALAQPGRFVEAIGLEDTPRARAIARGVGVQELVVGSGILARPRPYGLLYARVGGDLLHLSILGANLARGPKDRTKLLAAIGNVAAITVLDAIAARKHDPSPPPAAQQGRGGDDTGETVRVTGPVRVHATVTARASRQELHDHFVAGTELPEALQSLQVEEAGEDRFFWRAASGATGTTWFKQAPGTRGTEIHVEAELPSSKLPGKLGAKATSEQVMEGLRRIKQVIETGEIVRSDGNPDGPALHRAAKQHRAQPLATPAGDEG